MRSDNLVADGWSIRSLGELVEIFDGPHATPKKTMDGPIFLGVSSLANGRLNLSDVAHLSEEDFRKWTRRVTPTPGDVVFSYETRLGQAASIPRGIRCCLGRRMGLLRAKSRDIDPRFLLYAYLGPQFQRVIRDRTVHGSTVDRIPLKEMGSFPIALPPHDEQRRISSVLGALDDKIESNRRLARSLDQVAEAEYQGRFVDFVGVGELADSEIGRIPVGWESRPVSQLARYVNGKAFTKFGNERGRMVIRIADLKSGPGGSTVYTDHEAGEDSVARPGDILFAWSGSLDIYRWYRSEALINQHIFKVIPSEVPDWFIYFSLKHVMPAFQAIAADKATTMGHIKRSHLDEFSVAVPPADKMADFDGVFAPLFRRSLEALVESETLVEIRDVLLPRLVSGEMPVADSADPTETIEPLVEEHAV